LKGEDEGCGEIRAQNYYLVAPGTEIHYRDLRTSEPKIGTYTITQDRPFAKMRYDDFMKLFEPYLGSDPKQPITFEQMRKGVPQGTRHAQGIKFANYLVGVQTFDAATAFHAMQEWNKLNDPPMNEADLKRMVENALARKSKTDNIAEPVEKKTRRKLKDSGILAEGCFEAVYNDGRPFFLKLNGGDFSLIETVDICEETFAPKEMQNVPYEPYGYIIGQTPSQKELAAQIRDEFETWVDVEPIWKDVLTACVMLTYQQEKLTTVPYLFLYGDNESGKSTVLNVLKNLSYRPMYGVTIPSADLYGYLEDSDGQGCILEDEVQGIHKDTDKIKIYKAGYKAGAVVPRTLITSFDRIIKYYRTFCFKSCASEQIPQVKGFNERFLFIAMVEGSPRKEWADLTKEDKARMQTLRNMLLKWRMETRGLELPAVELAVKGRLKELWKPLLQITVGLPFYDNLFKFVDEQSKARLSGRQDTLEGKIVKVVVDLHNEAKFVIESLPFRTIWQELGYELNGRVNENKPNEMDTGDFGIITKNRVGYRLREILSGETKVIREKDSEGHWASTKSYLFPLEKLRRVAKKYGYELVTKLPSLLSSEGA